MYCTDTLLDLSKDDTKEMTEHAMSFIERTTSANTSPVKPGMHMDEAY